MSDWIEDRTRYNEDTLFKVRAALLTLLSEETARDCISEIGNAGILFRERSAGEPPAEVCAADVEQEWRGWEKQRNATVERVIRERDTERAAAEHFESLWQRAEAELAALRSAGGSGVGAPTPATTHKLKTWPGFFEAVVEGRKTFEVRKNDRDFKVGDTLVLRDWNPETGEYSGMVAHYDVTYVLHGPQFGIEAGFVALGFGSLGVHGGAPTPPAPLKPEYLASIRADIKRNQYAEPEDTERLIAEVERLYGQREMERGDDHA